MDQQRIHRGTGTFFLLMLGLWALINIFQGAFTQIGNDEAYYWMYSRYLSWGYFDHPPLIALFIKIGSLLFANELGVRAISILAQTLSICLIAKTIGGFSKKTEVILFFGIMAIIPVFAMYGFIATPDSPLLFFVAFFFYAYQQFLRDRTSTSTLLLAISMAGLMYSKYHGALVILLTILSNHRLLVSHRFWMAAVTALLLYLPHLLWQWQNHFPTFSFQTSNRMGAFQLRYFFEFWPQQGLAMNPIILLSFFIFRVPKLSKDPFHRSLVINIMGFFAFFWFFSFWTRPEPHWTAAACIPVIILLYKVISARHSPRTFILTMIIPSLVLVLLARLSVIFHILPFHIEFLGQKDWVEKASQIAGNLPVAFINSYQKASVYSFYSGRPAFTVDNIHYRKTQYDWWNLDQKYQGNLVNFFVLPSDSVSIPDDAKKVDRYYSFKDTLWTVQDLLVSPEIPSQVMSSGDPISMKAEISNPYDHDIRWNDPGHELVLYALYKKDKQIWKALVNTSPKFPVFPADKSITIELHWFVPSLQAGNYSLSFGFAYGPLPETFNSKSFRVILQ
jgi:hypothetical protein